jgi:hypothetical protein
MLIMRQYHIELQLIPVIPIIIPKQDTYYGALIPIFGLKSGKAGKI